MRQVRALDPRALVIKFKPYRVGWPDRSIYWSNGEHDLVELKRPKGGRFEPLQLRTHKRLRKMKHRVYVLNTKDLVDTYVLSMKYANEWGKRGNAATEHDIDT